MDGGPLRSVPRATDRETVSRPELTRRQSEELQSLQDEPRAVHRPAPPRHVVKEGKSMKRFFKPIILIVALVLVGVAGYFAWSKTQSVDTAIDTGKYQAVFFTNGQVYFGKLQPFTSDNMKLTDIYYLQSQQSTTDAAKTSKNPQETSTDQGNVQLIKLGDEIHGPDDMMILSKSQVLFYENLKTDSKVAQSIQKYKTSK